jgi:FAD/FMN-containing dehydrogenase
VLLAAAGGGVWLVIRAPVDPGTPPLVVNDVTQLNPIRVARILTPEFTDDIVAAIRGHAGPVSIGGGRYSQGGQTAADGSLHLDMRRLNRVIAFDPAAKTITVQAGATWRQVQERIDPANLSVKIMQSYANFTVGGSLSVNAHGRYVGLGPMILSVRAIQMVLADGTLVDASPAVNAELFYGAIGGYGGLGVITQATLDLADNVRVERQDRTLPVTAYSDHFLRDVRDAGGVVFHNADIYPDDYRTVHAVTYRRTERPVTVPDRLMPAGGSYRFERLFGWLVSEAPLGKRVRRHVVDPILFRGEPVTWRNYEASYDAAALEPASRRRTTYILQEYFIPVERFDAFVPVLRDVLTRHGVNVLNVSIRHAAADPGSLLAWARGDVFAFVLYYKQGTAAADIDAAGVWARELVEAALRLGGTYYLQYQLHATETQFLRAYPRAPAFFALKKRVDPSNTFRNKLWDKYYVQP